MLRPRLVDHDPQCDSANECCHGVFILGLLIEFASPVSAENLGIKSVFLCERKGRRFIREVCQDRPTRRYLNRRFRLRIERGFCGSCGPANSACVHNRVASFDGELHGIKL